MYRGRIETAEGPSRRFRLLLFVALPDRVHGEVLSPLGRPQLILDGGNGRLAVTFVKDGESFVGAVRRESLEAVLGVPIELDRLARALWRGEQPGDGLRVVRRAEGQAGLPSFFEIRSASGVLALELKRLRPLKADPTRLGTGEPPVGTRVRPLGELEGEERRLGELTEEGES